MSNIELSDDFKNQAKDILLNLAEDVAEDSVKAVFDLTELAIKESPNKIDDMALVLLPKLEQIVLAYVEKIHDETEE